MGISFGKDYIFWEGLRKRKWTLLNFFRYIEKYFAYRSWACVFYYLTDSCIESLSWQEDRAPDLSNSTYLLIKTQSKSSGMKPTT